MKVYEYQCNRCYFHIDDKERMINHCLNAHGVTGKFKKGYKIITKYKKISKKEYKIEAKMAETIKPIEGRWKRKYLRGKQAPDGAKVFTGESGKQYYMKEIGKKNSYITG